MVITAARSLVDAVTSPSFQRTSNNRCEVRANAPLWSRTAFILSSPDQLDTTRPLCDCYRIVSEPIWTFARGIERVHVRRASERELEMASLDGVERFEFTTIDDLVAFHVRLEEHLRAQGWTLVKFSPEGRSGLLDRRRVRRPAADRRKIGKKREEYD